MIPQRYQIIAIWKNAVVLQWQRSNETRTFVVWKVTVFQQKATGYSLALINIIIVMLMYYLSFTLKS